MINRLLCDTSTTCLLICLIAAPELTSKPSVVKARVLRVVLDVGSRLILALIDYIRDLGWHLVMLVGCNW